MFHRTVLVTAFLAACGNGGEGSSFATADAAADAMWVPDPPLDVGGYRLIITTDFGWAPGPRITLEPDGSFIGHDYETLWDCTGDFSEAEHASLTGALDAAWVLSRGDARGDRVSSEPAIYEITIEALSGPAAGRSNTFRYTTSGEGVPALDTAIARALAPVRAVQETGTCNACAPESKDWHACYEEHPFGQARVCVRGEARDCSPVLDGVVVDCEQDLLQCDPEFGWVPGERWELRDARAWRSMSGSEVRIYLQGSVWVENVANPPQALAELYAHFRLEDPLTGTEVTIWDPAPVAFGRGPPSSIPALVPFDLNSPASTAGLMIDAVHLRIRQHPWDGLPFGEPLLVPIADAPPGE